MDRRERLGSAQTAMRAVQQELAATLWTTLPGVINSYDPASQTCTIKPSIKARVQDRFGVYSWIELPLCLDCPVHFPAGGGLAMTFPVQAGDEALIVFADRCIDNWWKSGGIQEQADLRMHDLSDGFVFVGVSSLPRVMAALSTTTAQLRDTPGTTYVELTKAGTLNLKATTAINLQAPVITLQAPVINLASPSINFTGAQINVTGGLIINGTPYLDHRHDEVTTGTGQSGGVVS